MYFFPPTLGRDCISILFLIPCVFPIGPIIESRPTVFLCACAWSGVKGPAPAHLMAALKGKAVAGCSMEEDLDVVNRLFGVLSLNGCWALSVMRRGAGGGGQG